MTAISRSHAYRKRLIRFGNSGLRAPDVVFVLLVFVLSVVGIVMVYDASVAIAIRDFSDQYYYVREQLRWLVLGIVAFSLCSFVDYRKWKALALPFMITSLVLLMAVFIPGLGVKALGASRWIHIGSFVLQPAEVTKFALVVYMSAWVSEKEHNRLLAFLLLIAMVCGLVMLEPDMGTSVILLSIGLVLYFCSDHPLWHFLIMIPIALLGIVVLSVSSPYRLARLLTFVNPHADPLGSSYQIQQAFLAIGSGGIFGLGIGQSRQKYAYLPEANTDSIFAIVAEETGFIGSSFLLMLFVLLLIRGLRIASAATDGFGRLMAIGITMWIATQAALNIAAIVGIMPLTGIPLPLVSSGGSSLVITMTALGVLGNISRHKQSI